MGDGPVNRAIREGKARTSEISARVPELKDRVPDLRERVPDLKDRVPEIRARGAELTARGAGGLRTRSTELRTRGTELARHYARMDVRWARWAPVRALREGLMNFGLGPAIDVYTRTRVEGREVFDTLRHPVIFVANHSSHLDTPTILRALPLKWRQRTAVAAAADYFYKSRLKAYGVAVLLNTVPLARNGGGMSNGATDHVDRLIDQRWNLLMFPEGTRSRDGRIGKLRSGAAVLAAEHGIAIIPIHVTGTHAAMPPGLNWPKRLPGRFVSRRHQVVVRFGEPIWPREDEHRTEVMARVREFLTGEPASPQPAELEPVRGPELVIAPEPEPVLASSPLTTVPLPDVRFTQDDPVPAPLVQAHLRATRPPSQNGDAATHR
jgi:1-acyl-sn-glycerol-3-phosphate acyltransferase